MDYTVLYLAYFSTTDMSFHLYNLSRIWPIKEFLLKQQSLSLLVKFREQSPRGPTTLRAIGVAIYRKRGRSLHGPSRVDRTNHTLAIELLTVQHFCQMKCNFSFV